MELAIAAGSLKVAFNLVIFGIKLDQVPATVRRCFELVRTCHRDLEDLIKLRNESLPMLESKPAILERLNTIIENAHKGLLEVARLVEKLRPEVHDGSSRFLSRLEWIFIDSSEFTSQESLISRQHSSVIAELNFLRQLVLLTPLVDGVKTSKDAVVKVEKRPVVAWDNVALLDEMLGGNKKTYSTSNQSTPNQSTSNRSTSGRREPLNVNMSQVRPVSSTGSMLTDPPPPYASPNPSFALPSTLQSPTMEIRHPSIYNAAISNAPGPSATFEGQAVVRSKTKTTFNSDGVAFLFSDVKMPTKKEVIPVQRGQSVQDTMPEVQQPSTYYKVDPMASPLPAGNPLSIDSMSRANNNPQPATMQSTIQGVPLVSRQENFWNASVASHASTASEDKFYLSEEASLIKQQLKASHQQYSYAVPMPLQNQTHIVETNNTAFGGLPLSGQDLHLHSLNVSIFPQLAAKPLSTIPQELIHRHDTFERPLQSPPTQAIAIPAVASATACSAQPYTWQQVSVSGQRRYLSSTPSNPIAGGCSTPSPLASIHPTQRYLPEEVMPAPPLTSSEGTARAFPGDGPSYLDSTKGMTTYATARGHWRPEHPASQHGRHQSEPNSMRTPRRNDQLSGAGFHNASSGEQVLWSAGSTDAVRRPQNRDGFFMPHGSIPDAHAHADRVQQDINELSAVIFPPDPVELE